MARFDDTHYLLLLTDLATGQNRQILVANDAALENFWWKSDELIVVELAGGKGGPFRTLDVASGKVKDLLCLRSLKYCQMVDVVANRPNEMLLEACAESFSDKKLYRVSLQEDKLVVVEKGEGIEGWVTSPEGDPVAAWGIQDETFFCQTRSGPKSEWIRRSSPKGQLPEATPLGLAADHRRILMKDYRQKPDLGEVSAFDPATGNSESLASSPFLEIASVVRWGPALQVAGAAFETGPRRVVFFDPEAKAVDDWLETKLPGLQRHVVSVSADGTKAIVEAWSGRNAGTYCLVDIKEHKLQSIGPIKPELDGLHLVGGTHFEFAARDGQKLCGRIVLPYDGGPRPPLVVLVGFSKTSMATREAFDPEMEFFAHHGYAAVRIDHRGTGGYGRNFARAGNYHIHDVVAGDVLDGVAWLRNQGWVDPQRAAIYGSRTGGWVAFQLAAKPGPFRVLLNERSQLQVDLLIEGVFTSKGMFELLSDDMLAAEKRAVKKYEDSISPLAVAATLPIASFHGYVPGDFPKKLEEALKKARPPHEFYLPPAPKDKSPWIDWREQAKRLDAMIAFLDKQL